MMTTRCHQNLTRPHKPPFALLSLVLLCVLSGVVTNAQLMDRFKSMDANGDGKISRDEFVGGDAMFSMLDANKDGFIDADEAKRAEELLRSRKAAKAGAKKGRAATGAAALPDDIEVKSDIVYKQVGSQAIALDLYRVKGKTYEKAPLAIFIHGGGYIGGNKQDAVKRHASIFLPLLQSNGYQVVSLDYRLCTPKGAKLVDCSTDCKDAVRFLVKNSATYGIDTNRIASLGTSAGGSLSLLLPLSKDNDLPGDPDLAKYPSPVKCAVSWFGCTDFSQKDLIKDFNPQKVQNRTPVLFKSVSYEDTHEAEGVSPVYYMKQNGTKPHLLLIHGDSDKTVPIQQSVWLHSEAEKTGCPATFVKVKNAGHGFQEVGGPIAPSLEEINKMTLNFFLDQNK